MSKKRNRRPHSGDPRRGLHASSEGYRAPRRRLPWRSGGEGGRQFKDVGHELHDLAKKPSFSGEYLELVLHERSDMITLADPSLPGEITRESLSESFGRDGGQHACRRAAAVSR